MRGSGRIYRREDSRWYWVQYSHRGQVYRESTETDELAEAQKFLKKRLRETGADKLGLRKFAGPRAEKLSMSDLFDSLLKDFELREIKSLAQSRSHVSGARAAFGSYRAMQITPQLIDGWLEMERSSGVPPSTLNRRLQMVKQALALAVSRGLLPTAPHMRKLSEMGRERKGFFEKADFEAVVQHLPDYLKDFARFAYLTGWRSGAIKSLEWADVDPEGRTIHLRPEHDKKGEGQTLVLEGELWAIVHRCTSARIVRNDSSLALYLFHLNGRPVGDFRKSWATACKKAGIPGRMFHDFRRTAARNLIRAGVPERIAMGVTGHRTRAIFDRYNIVAEDDLREAQRKLQEHLGTQSGGKVIQYKKEGVI